jgi:hypothetical protein
MVISGARPSATGASVRLFTSRIPPADNELARQGLSKRRSTTMAEHDAIRERSSKKCIGCATLSPEAEGEYALIREGWRVTVGKDETGRKASDWWCPTCFAKTKPKAPKRS